jgi:LysM repeat protein
MALDHPAVKLSSGRWLHGSRALELGLVVALTVAVVAVAALWGSSSEESVPDAVVSLDAPRTDFAPQPASQTPVTVNDNPAEAEPVQASRLARESMSLELERDPTRLATPTGVLREIPNFGNATLPDSFERHQVLRGETLLSIADERALTVSELLLWNRHLDEESILIPGEWISIPQWLGSAVADEPNPDAEGGKSGRGGG